MEKRWDLFRRWILLNLFPYADRLRHVLRPDADVATAGRCVGDRAAGAAEAPARAVGAAGPAAAAAGSSRPAAAEVPAGRGSQAGPRGVFRRLRGRCHVPPRPLGDGSRAAAERLRRVRAARTRLLRRDPLAQRRPARRPAAGRRQSRGLRARPLRRDPGEPRRLRGDAQGIRPCTGTTACSRTAPVLPTR